MPDQIHRTLEQDEESLLEQYFAGEFEEFGEGDNRGFRFAEGTIWIPRAIKLSNGLRAVEILLALPLVVALGSAIVGWADGLPWAWAATAVFIVLCAILVALKRHMYGLEEAQIKALRLGLFLRPDAAIVRDGPSQQVHPRSHIKKVAIVTSRASETAEELMHLNGVNERLVSTRLKKDRETLAVLREWVAGASEDR